MPNLHYNIKEVNDEQPIIDIDDFLQQIDIEHKEYIVDKSEIMLEESDYSTHLDMSSHVYALELDYTTNYTVKGLSKILDYYKLNKQKLNKQHMIEAIIVYETDKDNIAVVHDRRRLWKNIKELKKHDYFSKYILSEWP